jgi:hypothetical protein
VLRQCPLSRKTKEKPNFGNLITLLAACCMLVSCLAYFLAQKMEVSCSSKTSVDFQWTTHRHIPEDTLNCSYPLPWEPQSYINPWFWFVCVCKMQLGLIYEANKSAILCSVIKGNKCRFLIFFVSEFQICILCSLA